MGVFSAIIIVSEQQIKPYNCFLRSRPSLFKGCSVTLVEISHCMQNILLLSGLCLLKCILLYGEGWLTQGDFTTVNDNWRSSIGDIYRDLWGMRYTK